MTPFRRLLCRLGLHSLSYGEALHVECARCSRVLRDQDGHRVPA